MLRSKFWFRSHFRIHSSHNDDDDDVNELLDLEVQSQEVMREWTSLLGAHHINTTNNNANLGINNNNPTTDSGYVILILLLQFFFKLILNDKYFCLRLISNNFQIIRTNYLVAY